MLLMRVQAFAEPCCARCVLSQAVGPIVLGCEFVLRRSCADKRKVNPLLLGRLSTLKSCRQGTHLQQGRWPVIRRTGSANGVHRVVKHVSGGSQPCKIALRSLPALLSSWHASQLYVAKLLQHIDLGLGLGSSVVGNAARPQVQRRLLGETRSAKPGHRVSAPVVRLPCDDRAHAATPATATRPTVENTIRTQGHDWIHSA
mmetsp:Transcript_39970/g.86971  ORF Transcript_39970/g.86971 Transcript_39970/m.86971 type:complete len:201 (-) Transcript_39970:100-702(-)